LALSAVFGLVLFAQATAGAEIRKQTLVYKTVGTLPVKADVYRTEKRAAQPVVVWIHGGALINGNRDSIPPRIKDPLLETGHILVSIDYRLAPETKLPGVIEDIEDAFRWFQKDGPRLFQADARRVAVIGGSAGGYLTLATGFRVRPRPAALVALWGYGDLVGPWYSRPSPHPCHHTTRLTREEAFRQVAGPPVADSRDRKGNGGAFYQFCRQQGLWPKAVSGWDPHTEVEKFVPYMPVRNVDPLFPPTLLVHGEADTDVPCEQSTMMAAALRQNKVEHRLMTVPKAEHGLAGASAATIAEAYRAAVEFLKTKLKQLPR
jgi:acetyl esterase/lipase